MIRRLLQALDPDLFTASRAVATPPAKRRAIAVASKTLRGSRATSTAAQHVLAAYGQTTGVVLASTHGPGVVLPCPV
ncbi:MULTISPECIES: hypothetical protein [unclassified Micromonospora]|uniref:hypothetical protein n=1 Tax=unclassified Micromonospora TaxID=2617518 RepID=UPI002FF04330